MIRAPSFQTLKYIPPEFRGVGVGAYGHAGFALSTVQCSSGVGRTVEARACTPTSANLKRLVQASGLLVRTGCQDRSAWTHPHLPTSHRFLWSGVQGQQSICAKLCWSKQAILVSAVPQKLSAVSLLSPDLNTCVISWFSSFVTRLTFWQFQGVYGRGRQMLTAFRERSFFRGKQHNALLGSDGQGADTPANVPAGATTSTKGSGV